MDIALEKLLTRGLRLPTIPRVAQQLLALTNRSDTSCEQLARVLASDPAIASTVLRYVNSIAYAQAEKIVSLQKAIVTLGFNAITNLALTFSLMDGRQNQHPHGLNAPLFWRRSLLSAIAAKVIGEQAGEQEGETLFLAGLLQDIGILALAHAKPEFYEGIGELQIAHTEICEYEKIRLTLDHAEFGAWLTKGWGFPEVITQAIAQSHQTPFSREGDQYNRFNACVAVSGLAADVFLDKAHQVARFQKMAALLQRGLNVDAAGSKRILRRMQEELKSMSWVLEKLTVKQEEIHQLRVMAQAVLKNKAITEAPPAATAAGKQRTTLDLIKRPAALDDVIACRSLLDQQTFEARVTQPRLGDTDHSLPLALLKIDNLHDIERQFGEKVAALLLRVVGRNLASELRKSDWVCRYDDIFAIALVDATEDGARIAMERVLEHFRGVQYSVGNDQNVEMNMCVGIAIGASDKPESFERSINLALQALDAAHDAGKYQIVSYLRAT